MKKGYRWWFRAGFTALLLLSGILRAVAQAGETHILPRTALAARHFGNDAPWFEQNIPFFDCSDPQITQIYYRWKLYKSHLKDLGERGYIVTEFLDDVGWAWNASQSLNDATTFHIMEGRWLQDSRYLDNYIDYMDTGGNDRHFSEAIAAATYARYLVNADRAFATRQLAEMKRIYSLWDDHYDAAQELYFIEPLSDATEYTIASIDATGSRDGFVGGDAFRPSINSYMQANADAISKLSALTGDAEAALAFLRTLLRCLCLTLSNLRCAFASSFSSVRKKRGLAMNSPVERAANFSIPTSIPTSSRETGSGSDSTSQETVTNHFPP